MFLQGAAAAMLGGLAVQSGCSRRSGDFAASKVEQLTSGPQHHWFGYYDKLQFDPTNRFLLGMAVDFADHHPTPDDAIGVGMVDRAEGNRWIPLATSRAWSWQQGCMLQWIPGARDEIIFNDRERDSFVARILNVRTRAVRTLPKPVYALSPDGATAVTTDFARIGMIRYGYGYPVRGGDKEKPVFAGPADTGIWRMSLVSGQGGLILPLVKIMGWPGDRVLSPDAVHWINHLLYSPDGSRLAFLHRWRESNRTRTRLLTCDPDGGNLFQINPGGTLSHFIWRDPTHLLAWASVPGRRGAGFFLFNDRSREAIPVGAGVMRENGHCTCLAGGRWILNDTYASARNRVQELYLYDTTTNEKHALGRFPMPASFEGGRRCDLHPRVSSDGRLVAFDSAHRGDRRQMYLIDVTEIVTSNRG
ncbi:MAG: hypothetical protein CVU59_07335 [Deltaproteobacteria bacterium HGW-Deltaproteobacteria-17]|nr:MAG: hypothetical protein CVU59_07335 [Deltaproteobacteria bacterium HGW-Deltaproteobacteria-17]